MGTYNKPKLERDEHAKTIAKIILGGGDETHFTLQELADKLSISDRSVRRIVQEHKRDFELISGVVILTHAGYRKYDPKQTEDEQ